jgi:hypothetical protein
LTFHLIDPDWKLDSESIFTDDFNDFRLIFELLAFILDLGSGGQARGDLGLHSIDDLEVGVFGFLKSDAFRAVRKITDLDSDFIVLVDLDVLEHHLCRDDLEGLSIDRVLLRG